MQCMNDARCKRRTSHMLLFFCDDVQGVWASDLQWQWLPVMQGKIGMEIFNHALEEDKDPSLLAFTAWALWIRRNQLQLNKAPCPLNQILQVSNERKRKLQFIHLVTPKQQHRKHTRWKQCWPPFHSKYPCQPQLPKEKPWKSSRVSFGDWHYSSHH